MTREEAINRWVMPAIKNTWNEGKCEEIIEALEQEPCEDAISRQAVLKLIKERCNPYGKPTIDFEEGKKLLKYIDNLPSVNPQPKTEQELCDDAISRQAALDTFGLSEKSRKYGGDHSGYHSGYDTIML